MPIDVNNRPTGTWVRDTTQFEPESAVDTFAPLIDDLNMRLMNGAMSQALYGIVQSAVQ